MSDTPVRRGDLPGPENPAAVFAFAMMFNAYNFHGSFEACAAAARASRRSTLTELRTELFFAARASRHGNDDRYLDVYRTLLPLFRAQLEAAP